MAPIDRLKALPISVNGLQKSFGSRRVIQDLGLHVPAGQFLAVVGSSGGGKSTLLRLIGGLETPDSGTIRFGNDIASPASLRLMFQEPRLLPWARVGDNVAVGLGLDRVDASQRDRVQSALAEVGLDDRADLWPATLSGGQKQRVALARALVSQPRILALDEPLGALDALTRLAMQALVERVWLENGFTAILVTHDVSEAVALADRVIVLGEGRVALDIDVPIARPRKREAPELAALRERVLAHLLGAQKDGVAA